MAEVEELKSAAEIEEKNESIIRYLFEGLNRASIEILEEIYAPNVAFHFPSIADPLSKEATIEFLKTVYDAYPDTHWDVQDMIATGDKVIVWSIVTGTNKGDYPGIPATGKKIRVGEIVLYRLQGGRIVEERVERDVLGQVTQLGMQLKPSEAAE